MNWKKNDHSTFLDIYIILFSKFNFSFYIYFCFLYFFPTFYYYGWTGAISLKYK